MPNAHSNSQIPDKPKLEGLEQKWQEIWDSNKTYAFNRDTTREQVYSIDTPPPTASGALHIGHSYSYTHTDIIARFKRMQGFEVFYPMGWDDNGLPTERRVQNYYGVRCDPTLPYIENFTPPFQGNASTKAADQQPISRRNFIELCEELTIEDEKKFEEIWRTLGLSTDWSQTYRTIDQNSQRIAQLAFLRNLSRGEAYQADAPTLWDITFRTAVAQAELEDKDMPGAYHTLVFAGPEGDIHIDTTRPELLAACVALVAHPDDERFTDLFGKTATTPIFGVEVPILPHLLAQKDKGTGIAMVCTFGDMTDVIWWRELDLPNRAILNHEGRIIDTPPAAITSDQGLAAFADLKGLTVFSAKKRIVELLQETGQMLGDPRPMTHPVKFFEKGDRPLEIVSTRQWYIKNGGRDASLRDRLIAKGTELNWTPDFMRVRYENWVNGLNGDWLISRQRFFGIPLPVWYGLDSNGDIDFDTVLTPEEGLLPIDPTTDVPAGFTEDQRGAPGGFVGEQDVMDTWAASSLTPQLVGGWERDEELWNLVSPFSLRPQGQDIIRTWLFSTVLRSELEQGALPWKNTTISGFIVDPERKKMSKSKGNTVTPVDILNSHGADAVRYWAGSSRLGADTAFDPQNPTQMKIGRRLAIKVLNAAKFILSFDHNPNATISESLDVSMLQNLADTIVTATKALDAYDHARALEVTETLFWTFCDDYLELVKERAYTDEGQQQASAVRALRLSLDVFLRLLAPFIPFATEEVWSWYQAGSVHRSSWPTAEEVSNVLGVAADSDQDNFRELLNAAGSALATVRGVKTDAKVSQKTRVISVVLGVPEELLDALKSAEIDLRAAGNITELIWQRHEAMSIQSFELESQEK